jgi:hypothetical protein
MSARDKIAAKTSLAVSSMQYCCCLLGEGDISISDPCFFLGMKHLATMIIQRQRVLNAFVNQDLLK